MGILVGKMNASSSLNALTRYLVALGSLKSSGARSNNVSTPIVQSSAIAGQVNATQAASIKSGREGDGIWSP
jgi:hypothetical protein